MATVSSGILSAAALFLRANIIGNNIHNPQKYLRFSVTGDIIYLGNHQKYNLLHSIPSTPRVAVPKKRTEDLAMTDYGRMNIFLGESRVNRSALLLQQQVFLHNKIKELCRRQAILRCPRFFAF